MSIREVIAVVNQMEVDGIVDRYAIGGAVGATFYLEPVATLDVDVFVTFRLEPSTFLIGGWPVQFLPPTGPLVEEGLAMATEIDVEGERARVFTAEHLAAIALQTGRAKDKARVLQFIEEGVFDDARFQEIIRRHGLVAAWAKFEGQFLT